jgi:hypothetical protein
MSDLVPVRVGIVDETPEWEFDAFHDPEDRWNGWLNPYFTKDEAVKVGDMFATLDQDIPVKFWFTTDRQGRDALIILEHDGNKTYYTDCHVTPDGLIGITHAWTWWEVEL